MDKFDLSQPERAALSWALGELGCGPAVAAPPLAGTFATSRLSALRLLSRFGPFKLDAVTRDQGMITAILNDPKGKTFHLKLGLEAEALAVLAFGSPPPDGFQLRDAHQDDSAAIAAVERDSPIELADGRSFRVFRPRLGDFFRLQERTFMALVERDGKPVAARVIPCRTLNLRDGNSVTLSTSQMARVLPSMRGFNLMRCFGLWAGVAVASRAGAGLAYIDPGNEAADAAFPVGRDRKWKRRVLELTFACTRLAGPAYGRSATRGDAARIAALSNWAHGREALYGVLDEQTVAQKLERAPEVYTWHDVQLSEHAMLGVWASLDETTDFAPGQEPKRRTLSVTLDYGFEGDAGVRELLLLLGAQSARVQSLGATHLTLYTHAGAPVVETLSPLAEDRIEIAVSTPLPEPADSAGIYTDPLYI